MSYYTHTLGSTFHLNPRAKITLDMGTTSCLVRLDSCIKKHIILKEAIVWNNGTKINIDISLVEKKDAICACTISYSRVDSNVCIIFDMWQVKRSWCERNSEKTQRKTHYRFITRCKLLHVQLPWNSTFKLQQDVNKIATCNWVDVDKLLILRNVKLITFMFATRRCGKSVPNYNVHVHTNLGFMVNQWIESTNMSILEYSADGWLNVDHSYQWNHKQSEKDYWSYLPSIL